MKTKDRERQRVVCVNFNVSLLSTHTKYLYSFVCVYIHLCVLNARGETVIQSDYASDAPLCDAYHHPTRRFLKP